RDHRHSGVRRCAPPPAARSARGPAPSPPARLHDRRPVAALARMIDPVSAEERRLPITPQLALRIAILGGIALVLFAIVFFPLWYLQVLSGAQVPQQAR